jgi:hypothetical protein
MWQIECPFLDFFFHLFVVFMCIDVDPKLEASIMNNSPRRISFFCSREYLFISLIQVSVHLSCKINHLLEC